MDFNQEGNPQLLEELSPISSSTRVVIDKNRAYLASLDNGLQVIDITDPRHLQIMSVNKTPYYARDVSIQGSRAYVCDWYAGLQIFDVSNSYSPILLTKNILPHNLSDGVAVKGNVLYQVNTGQLQIIDVTDPANTILRAEVPIPGYYSSSGWSRRVVAYGELAFVVTGYEGLLIFHVKPPVL